MPKGVRTAEMRCLSPGAGMDRTHGLDYAGDG